ncbi:unnamed protein product, partial [Heligmosomoides polygyrus]|uniref:Methyltransferase n=1 Tax=Heligmosomoides polygyrus TaxID=6339 RepID=A0A183GWV9_HELPZ
PTLIQHYRRAIVTAKGIASYAEIERNVFRPNNYFIEEASYPIPKLRFIEKPTCGKIFGDWLEIARSHTRAKFPPREIDESQKNAFLLNGYAKLYKVSGVLILVNATPQ